MCMHVCKRSAVIRNRLIKREKVLLCIVHSLANSLLMHRYLEGVCFFACFSGVFLVF